MFDVLDWTGILNGSFSDLSLPSGGIWDTSRLLSSGEIEYVGETPSGSIPEPTTLLLLTTGLGGLAGMTRLRRRHTQ